MNDSAYALLVIEDGVELCNCGGEYEDNTILTKDGAYCSSICAFKYGWLINAQ